VGSLSNSGLLGDRCREATGAIVQHFIDKYLIVSYLSVSIVLDVILTSSKGGMQHILTLTTSMWMDLWALEDQIISRSVGSYALVAISSRLSPSVLPWRASATGSRCCDIGTQFVPLYESASLSDHNAYKGINDRL
jgi:hypothetical protein